MLVATSPAAAFRLMQRHYGPQYWWPAENMEEVCIGAILTQNTAWKNVEKAIENLREGKLLSLKSLAKAEEQSIAKAVKPSGYYNQKAKRLKLFAQAVGKQGGLEKLSETPLPQAREWLLQLNGVGKETADSILLYALGKPSFVIDAYTIRWAERMGWGHFDYDGAKEFFEASLSKTAGKKELAVYNEFHALVVEHCKSVCTKKPSCGECFLKTRCAYGTSGTRLRKQKAKEKEFF